MVWWRKIPILPMILIILFWIAAIFGFLFLKNPLLLIFRQPSINVYSWTELIDMRKVAEFQKQTGIKVNVGYFESNEELYAKIKLTKGIGYDLIVPSDYMADQFVKEKEFLQKIDHSKLDFWQRLNPHLLGQYFDPRNEYVIPYMWSIYGIGINKNAFPSEVKKDWALLFDTAISHVPRIMIDDMRELTTITAYYAFGSLDGLDKHKYAIIRDILLKQKKYVLAYREGGAPYPLAANQSPLVLASSPYVLRIIEKNKDIDFIVPDTMPIVAVDTLVIPATSTKQDLVYQFINFLFKPEVVQFHVDQTFFLPTVTDVSCKDVASSSRALFASCARGLRQFKFLKNVIPAAVVNDITLQLKT